MTEAQLRKRVKHWQERLGLSHWEIDVRYTDGDPQGKKNSAAAVTVLPSYDSADIEFSRPELATLAAQDIDRTIVHELVHVMVRDLEETIYFVEDYVPEDAFAVWEKALDHAAEGLIERVARAFVPLSEH